MKLSDLSPRLSPPGKVYQELAFRCPRCQKHEIMIAIWPGPACDYPVRYGENEGSIRLWQADQGATRDWDSLSITPSIDRSPCGDPCGGWHGFIVKGEAV